MEPSQDTWINAILTSTDGLQRATPSPFLYAKIWNRLNARLVDLPISGRTVWLAATALIVLIVLNWTVASQHSAATPTDTAGLQTVVSDMNLYPAPHQLYTQ